MAENNEPKILIAIPCMDKVEAQFAQALATLEKVGHCIISMEIGSLIYNSRNNLCKTALQLNCDYILWLDSDMVFPPETLKRLLEVMEKTGADIVSGLYFRRVAPYTPVAFSKLDINGKLCSWENYNGPLDQGPQEVPGIGFGCVLHRTELLLEMAAQFTDFFGPLANVGEDLSFCWRARQLGYKIVLDTNLKLGHVGHAVITEDFYKCFADVEKDGGNKNG